MEKVCWLEIIFAKIYLAQMKMETKEITESHGVHTRERLDWMKQRTEGQTLREAGILENLALMGK
ncbi:hypothetical protein A2547_02465 [candidate division WWE3 bacterium RIFOXYD2_FULL_43_10]|nr:MAG: hypothetical protein A2547_02465 [candidate division WWE3 bacterium RIFOXYD2_FULL_43_10]